MFRRRKSLLFLILATMACTITPIEPAPEEEIEEQPADPGTEPQDTTTTPADTTTTPPDTTTVPPDTTTAPPDTTGTPAAETLGCPGTSVPNPAVLFCDAFDDGVPVADKWAEYHTGGGNFSPVAGEGVDGSTAMRVQYNAGEVELGWLSIGIGDLPAAYSWFSTRVGQGNVRELYWREYIRLDDGWDGIPFKQSRIRVLAEPNSSEDIGPWRSAFQAHFWPLHFSGPQDDGVLMFDNTRGVDGAGNVIDRGNNSGTSVWLPRTVGSTLIYGDKPNGSDWMCIEAHIKLNDPGQSNGIEEFWLDGELQARRTDQNQIGTYTDFGINHIAFDNYWNGGSPQDNTLYRDNIVISTERIGCLD